MLAAEPHWHRITPLMKRSRIALAGGIAAVLVGLGVWAQMRTPDATIKPTPTPVISVTLVHPEHARLPLRVAATGSVAAWQEASIGAEADGQRLVDVRVNVGDAVRQGDLLARFSPDLLQAELAEAEAAVALARAEADEAAANAQRAVTLDTAGVMSRQQVDQYRAVALTTRARLASSLAAQSKARLRVRQTEVRAPGDGVITARPATVGAVVPAGQELFRLIRDGRLEWRASVASPALAALEPGQRAVLTVPGAEPIIGRVRLSAPMIDAGNRQGMVYVDLPPGSPLHAGNFAQGHIEIGEATALTLPQTAVVMRDGFHYVMQVNAENIVRSHRVSVGQRAGDRIAIATGLSATDTVVAAGLAFLNDGDAVQVERATVAPSRGGSR
jgi:HlyD family secretion protein